MNSKRKILFIINPISGVGKKNSIPTLIEKYLDKNLFDFQISYTERRGHGFEIASNEKSNYDIVVAVGGDGSVNEIGSALINSDCSLGIIPCGSGNGLARHAKIPLKHHEAILRLNKSKPQRVDVGQVNDKLFLGTCGFGFDALIAKKFDQYHKRGFLSYIKLVLSEYRKYIPKTYIIQVGENKYERTALMCSVANSSQFGNGFTISPLSDLQDGTFELILLKKISFFSLPSIALRFFRGTIHKHKKFESFSFKGAASVEIKDEEPAFLHFDGEPSEQFKLFEVKILKGSLLLV